MKNLEKQQIEFSKKLELEKEEIATLTASELKVLWGGNHTQEYFSCRHAGPHTVEMGCDPS